MDYIQTPEATTWIESLVDGSRYKGFGSFHSENVEDLIKIPVEDYIPPDMPFPWVDDFAFQGNVEFGKKNMAKYFLLDKSFTFLNHGAFGASLKPVMALAERWRVYTEEQPLRMIDRKLFPHMVRCLREISPFVGSDPTNLVFVQNATSGFNAVINSVMLSKGDSVFALDIAYGSLKKLLRLTCQTKNVSYVEGNIPQSSLAQEDLIVEFVRSHLPENCRLAVFDHVTSNTAVVMPIQKLTKLCHERGIAVLIDGAHGLLSMPLNLEELGADYYITNCHKWFCSAKGVGLLYVKKNLQASFHHVLASHGYHEGFLSEFIWDGTRDYSSALSLSTAIRFWSGLGVSSVRGYIDSLKRDADHILRKGLNATWLVPLDRCGWMACLAIPDECARAVFQSCQSTYPTTGFRSEHAKLLQDYLHYIGRIEVPVKLLYGALYLRISFHIYNDVDDFRVLARFLQSPPCLRQLLPTHDSKEHSPQALDKMMSKL